jgi:hypothetical protein
MNTKLVKDGLIAAALMNIGGGRNLACDFLLPNQAMWGVRVADQSSTNGA